MAETKVMHSGIKLNAKLSKGSSSLADLPEFHINQLQGIPAPDWEFFKCIVQLACVIVPLMAPMLLHSIVLAKACAAVKNDADSSLSLRQAQLSAWHEGVTKLTYHVSGRTQ